MADDIHLYLLVENVGVLAGTRYDIIRIDPKKYRGQEVRTGRTVDLVTTGNETPKTVLVRRIGESKQELSNYRQFLLNQEDRYNYVLKDCKTMAKKMKMEKSGFLDKLAVLEAERRKRREQSSDGYNSTDEEQKKINLLFESMGKCSDHFKYAEKRVRYRRNHKERQGAWNYRQSRSQRSKSHEREHSDSQQRSDSSQPRRQSNRKKRGKNERKRGQGDRHQSDKSDRDESKHGDSSDSDCFQSRLARHRKAARLMDCSTPNPEPKETGDGKLTCDRATQTEPADSDSESTIDERRRLAPELRLMEGMLKRLFKHYTNMIKRYEPDESVESVYNRCLSEASEAESSAEKADTSGSAKALSSIEERPDSEQESENDPEHDYDQDSEPYSDQELENHLEHDSEQPPTQEQGSNEPETDQADGPSTSEVAAEAGPSQPSTEEGPRGDELVPIGRGYAKVPAQLMNNMNWDYYSVAIRKLLQAVFPRKVLATHSLTGKPSPAFQHRPAKKCLDPKLVEDIVLTINDRCGPMVTDRMIRGCITVKCSDESKKYRARLRKKFESLCLVANSNQENIPPPESASSDVVEADKE